MAECPHCGNITDDPFCGSCGQKVEQSRLSIRSILNEAMAFMFSIESPLWRTVWMLFKNPGVVSRNFISGDRKTYYRPFQYFILAILVFFVVKSIFNHDPVALQVSRQALDPNNTQQLGKIPVIEAGQLISRNVNYFLPLLALIIGGLDSLFFHKSQYNYAERVSNALYLISHFILLNTLMIPFMEKWPSLLDTKYFIILGYTSYGLVMFHRRQPAWSAIKSLFMVSLGFLVYAAITFTTVLLFLL